MHRIRSAVVVSVAVLGFLAPGAAGQGADHLAAGVPEARGSGGHQPTLTETFHEDFESVPVGTAVTDVAGWGARSSLVVADLSSEFPEFGSRSAFLDDLSVLGLGPVALFQAPSTTVESPGVVSIDLVIEGTQASTVVHLRIEDLFNGLLVNELFFEGDGDIAYLDGNLLVDSGFDWAPGEVISVEFEQTLTGQLIIRVNGEVIALAPNFAGGSETSGAITFTYLWGGFGTDHDGETTGSLAFDNVRYRQAQPIEPPCAGDLDGDGVVGSADLATLLGGWGVCP